MTAIASICTPIRIILAAESSALNERGELVDTKVCKIRCLGVAFATANGIVNHPTGFDLFQLLPTAVQGTRTLQQLVDATERIVRGPLYSALEYEFKNNLQSFQRNAIDMAPLAITLVGQQNRRPVMANVRFVVAPRDRDFSLQIEKRFCPGPDCQNGYASIFVGTKEGSALYAERSKHYGFYESNDLVAIAMEFVQMEIDKNLPDFQPPIDILEITGTASRWIQKKPNC